MELIISSLLPSSAMPIIGWVVFVLFLIYLVKIVVWYKNSKNKSFKNLVKVSLPYIYVGLVIYFFFLAVGWENTLSVNWAENPELSSLSAILGYVKALVKIVVVTIVFKVIYKK